MPELPDMLESIVAIFGLFIVYTLRKTDMKIDKTASDLAAHKLEEALVSAVTNTNASRDYATKQELREVDKRAAESNHEVQVKLDRLIDRLIDHPRN